MKKVVVYSMLQCPYCVRAKALLDQRGIQHETIMIDDWSDEQWDNLVHKSGMKTVPQIYVDGELVGGYTQLAEIDARGEVARWRD